MYFVRRSLDGIGSGFGSSVFALRLSEKGYSGNWKRWATSSLAANRAKCPHIRNPRIVVSLDRRRIHRHPPERYFDVPNGYSQADDAKWI